ncbi:MAG: symporter small accessory protein [Chitinivibrionales bacterium]
MFLGIEGTGVLLAYVCTVLAALLCIVYGIINWNKPAETEAEEIAEEIEWEKHEPEVVEAGGAQ